MTANAGRSFLMSTTPYGRRTQNGPPGRSSHPQNGEEKNQAGKENQMSDDG